jgi:hypothetical protein
MAAKVVGSWCSFFSFFCDLVLDGGTVSPSSEFSTSETAAASLGQTASKAGAPKQSIETIDGNEIRHGDRLTYCRVLLVRQSVPSSSWRTAVRWAKETDRRKVRLAQQPPNLST